MGNGSRGGHCAKDIGLYNRLHEHEPAIANLMLRDLARILALRLRLASAVIADLRGS